jgi:hypothetical protein
VLGPRLDARRRRIVAIEEAAHALAGVDRAELIDSFLAAIERVVHGEVVLLFTNAVGDARFVQASRRVSADLASRIAPAVEEVMRGATAKTIDVIAPERRPVAGLAAGVVVPISVAGQEVRGALVVLRRASAFSSDDVAAVRPFAQYLWLVMRTAPAGTGRASAGRARRRTS